MGKHHSKSRSRSAKKSRSKHKSRREKRETRRTSKWTNEAPENPLQIAQQKAQNDQLFNTGVIKIQQQQTPNFNDAIQIKSTPQFPFEINAQNLQGGEQQLNAMNILLPQNQKPASAKLDFDMDSIIKIVKPQEQQVHNQNQSSQPIMNYGNIISNVPPLPFMNNPGIPIGVLNSLTDPNKMRKKVYIPMEIDGKPTNIFSYTGLIIGPKGANQRKMEEESKCKILVRGRGTQKEGHPFQPDDNEPTHVLIVGDNTYNIDKAVEMIERILEADDETRNRMRTDQLKTAMQIQMKGMDHPNNTLQSQQQMLQQHVDLSLTTPYGPPSQDAYIIPIPNDIVGLVIGKGGESIKNIQNQSGASKVQIAQESAQGCMTRNVFVEGSKEAIEKCKRMLQDIIEGQQKRDFQPNKLFPGGDAGDINQHVSLSFKEDMPVPNHIVGLIIGKGGETIKGLNRKTGAHIFIPPEVEPGHTERVLQISGLPEQIIQARQEINDIIEKNKRIQEEQLMQRQHAELQRQQEMYEKQQAYMQMMQQKQLQMQQQQQQQIQQQQEEKFAPMTNSILFMQQLFAQQQQDVITETIINDN